MKTVLASALLFAVLSSCGGGGKAVPTFDTKADPDFGDATAALKVFLAERDEVPAGKPQHFCIVGFPPSTPDGGSKRAWVHWKEGGLLILWEGGDQDQIAMSRRKLNLKEHVVATEAEVQGSTYLVTKAWVDQVLSACEASGTQYTVEGK